MSDLIKYSDEREAANAARVGALETLLIKKGVLGSDSVDTVLQHFETVAGPFNGARIVARAWMDPAYKQRLIEDTPKAIAELNFPLGMDGAEGEHMKAVANSASVHNLVICTLCSCYPWPVLGLPPYWYKDPVFRARGVRDHTLSSLAQKMSLIERHLSRVFKEGAGVTPMSFLNDARLDAVRQYLENSDLALREIALRCGFETADNLRRVFTRRFALSPLEYRQRFRSASPPEKIAEH